MLIFRFTIATEVNDLKNHTLIELTKEVKTLNRQITTLKNELGANTRATGKNTIAIEGIASEIKELAKETGDWRKDDNKHHKGEENKDNTKIDKMQALEKAVKELVEVLQKK